ncbi:Glutamate mutase subunit E [Chitinophaga rupis]|uniref:Glutamate mutase subunit E n=1 Tax=Chitinophaga rupis TaxID=573321 RepID=A0A1H8IWY6_9BACT|nr:methylaspartate mutase subunit E [Chitinophaga rupis]SEN72665.1 Glutamate mutase subunit E [Chitinophaga rupis]
MEYQHRILIGGIGDDAHSVGIGLLELGFKDAGFFVKSLGIRNLISSFFDHAPDFDIIMISNKNGHAELYLQDFARLMSQYKLTDDSTKLWYLGGSLAVSESDFQIKKKYLGMGFTNVYPKPVPFTQVLEEIRKDIHRHEIPKRESNYRKNRRRSLVAEKLRVDEITDRQWTREELTTHRKEVLAEWHTGREVMTDTYQNANKQHTLGNILWSNKQAGNKPLFQPRTGVADIEQQITLLQHLEAEGSDVSSVQLDAASRSRMYDKAELGKDLSIERKQSQLNGFPIPVYGVKEVRRLITSLKRPFQLRGGGPDHRFTYEIALAAGITAVEGGCICYCLPYDKLTNPIESLRNWQFIDRLSAFYEEVHDVSINREYFGTLTATLIEPSLAISVNVIQAILTAQQGVKNITVGYAEQGNRAQDIAAIQVMEEQVNAFLQMYGFMDVRVTTVYHQFMAAFPSDYKKAEDLIFNSSITATLAGATKVMVKTAVEAIRIPDRFDNAKAVKLSKQGALTAHHSMVNQEKLKIEKQLIRSEVKQIMDAVMQLSNGSIAKGAIKAIEAGILDIPWSPSIYNKGKVVGVRDIDGAVRFYDFGNLPFDEKTKDFHREKVVIRKNMERDSSIFSLLEKDLSRIWQNDYKTWPLDGTYVY